MDRRIRANFGVLLVDETNSSASHAKPAIRGETIASRFLGGLLGAFLGALVVFLLLNSYFFHEAERLSRPSGSGQGSGVGPFLSLLFGVGAITSTLIGTGLAATLGGILGAAYAPYLLNFGSLQKPGTVPGIAAPPRPARNRYWKPLGVVAEGQAIAVEGVNPWGEDWLPADQQPVELQHPTYPDQLHAFRVYSIRVDDQEAKFAAAEVSPGAWAFYVSAS